MAQQQNPSTPAPAGVWIYRGTAIAWTAVARLLIGVGGGGTTAQVRRRGIIATAITAGLPLLIFLLIV